jgi:hypothetical protein
MKSNAIAAVGVALVNLPLTVIGAMATNRGPDSTKNVFWSQQF